jgi:hypothetical protein
VEGSVGDAATSKDSLYVLDAECYVHPSRPCWIDYLYLSNELFNMQPGEPACATGARRWIYILRLRQMVDKVADTTMHQGCPYLPHWHGPACDSITALRRRRPDSPTRSRTPRKLSAVIIHSRVLGRPKHERQTCLLALNPLFGGSSRWQPLIVTLACRAPSA